MAKTKAEKTESRTDALNRLFKENGLLKEDFFEHKHYKIITRSGIEKIQYKNNIDIEFEAVTMTPELCVVKAKATMDEKHIQTFGSAGHGAAGTPDGGKMRSNQYLYYPEIAEKRALSRAVLKITDFYKYGVFSEDESEEFAEAVREGRKQQSKTADTPKPQPEERPDVNPANGADFRDEQRDMAKTAGLATQIQKDKILKLIKNGRITAEEREKADSSLDSLNMGQADRFIKKLESMIEEREGNQ